MVEPGARDPENAWEVLRSRYIVKDRWISLRADDCRTAAGDLVAPYYVLEYPPWVSIVAITPEREVVLIRQYRHGIARVILELPGGGMDDRDAGPLDAAKRELLEETGYDAEHWHEAGAFLASPHNHTNTSHAFLALGARLTAAPQHEVTEQIEVVLMPLEELIECAYRGELAHAHHLATLFFALRALKKT